MQIQYVPVGKRMKFAFAFDQLQRRARRKRIWARLWRRLQPLPSINLSRQQFLFNYHHQAGVQSIPLEQIRGSVGRSADFDVDFRPLKPHLRDRWITIAMALYEDVVLPAVDLVKVNGGYFVLDGHHRVSVAKFQDKVAIDANIIEWQGGV